MQTSWYYMSANVTLIAVYVHLKNNAAFLGDFFSEILDVCIRCLPVRDGLRISKAILVFKHFNQGKRQERY